MRFMFHEFSGPKAGQSREERCNSYARAAAPEYASFRDINHRFWRKNSCPGI